MNRVTTPSGQNTVGIIVHRTPIIVFDRESVQTQSTEKILDENELLERVFNGVVERGVQRFEFVLFGTWFGSNRGNRMGHDNRL
jgi:hypothetical protein